MLLNVAFTAQVLSIAYTHIHACMDTYIDIHINTHVCVCVYIYTDTHTHTHTHIYRGMACACIYIYIYIYIYISHSFLHGRPPCMASLLMEAHLPSFS
jgi:hypothetical protein